MIALTAGGFLQVVEVHACSAAVRVSTFIEEVARQLEVFWVLRDSVQPEECEFNFGMARIAMNLIFTSSEGVAEEGHILEDWVQ